MPDKSYSMLLYLQTRLEGDARDAQAIASATDRSNEWYEGYAAGLRSSLRVVDQSIRYIDSRFGDEFK